MKKSIASELTSFSLTIVTYYLGGYIIGYLLVKAGHWLGLF